jgi:hypothetical protein
MSVSSRQKYESAAIVKKTEDPLSESAGDRAGGSITAPTLQNSSSPPQVRGKKVLAIKQLLVEGRYDLNEHLDIALERLLEVIAT